MLAHHWQLVPSEYLPLGQVPTHYPSLKRPVAQVKQLPARAQVAHPVEQRVHYHEVLSPKYPVGHELKHDVPLRKYPLTHA